MEKPSATLENLVLLEQVDVLGRGLVLGLILAAPVGPVGIMCIRRTLQKGLWLGFVTGLGAAFVDYLFASVAVFGITAILEWVRVYNASIHLVGGLILLFVAWHTWHDTPRQPESEEKAMARINPKIGAHVGAAMKALLSSFLVTMTNPATLFGTMALVAAFGGLHDKSQALLLTGAVFCGSALWWMILSAGTSFFRCCFSEKKILLINKITAFLLAPIGLWALAVGVLGNLGYASPPY